MSNTPVHRHHPTTTPHPPGERRSWTLLVITLAAQVLVVLDISVVNTALPTIGQSLGLAGEDLQWVVTAYVMLSGGGLLLGGRISDLFSRRTVFLIGLALFTLASVASGMADTGPQLVAARAAQGLSAAVLTPAALSLITTSYRGHQQKVALALWGAVGSLGIAAGVLVGGAITTWTSWQFIFWVNAPVGVLSIAIGLRVLEREPVRRPGPRDLDLPGAATVIAGLSGLVYVLAGTSSHGWWSTWTAAGLAISTMLLSAFVVIERRASRPLFPPHVWKLRALVSGTAVMLGVTGLLVGAVFLASIFMQTVLGYSPVRTGVAFLPFALAITLGTVLARHLMAHLSPRTVATAGLALAAGAALLLSGATQDAEFAVDLLPGMLGLGLGVGMVFVPVSVTSMAGIPHSHAGVASGFLMTGHEIGAALGVAVLSAVASTAGSLVTPDGAADAFGRGFVAASLIAATFGAVAFLRMSAERVDGDTAGMHLH